MGADSWLLSGRRMCGTRGRWELDMCTRRGSAIHGGDSGFQEGVAVVILVRLIKLGPEPLQDDGRQTDPGERVAMLPQRSSHAPVAQDSWSSLSTSNKMPQVNSLLNLIENLKSVGFTGVWVTRHFIRRRIQPLKDRVHFAFDNTRSDDPTQEVAEVLSTESIRAQTNRMFTSGTMILANTSGFPKPLQAGNAPPMERHQYLSYPPSWASPELKRAAEAFSDEPAAKRLAFDLDAEPLEAPEDADAPSPTRSPSPPPLKRLRRPIDKQGSRPSRLVLWLSPRPCSPWAHTWRTLSQSKRSMMKSWSVLRLWRVVYQVAALGELKKANTRLQAECARLLAVKAELEAKRSQLSATKTVLEAECA
uniref:Uncharacterized protein n=1 Tax=Oryza brachyantha TaxID=4533 RepID=J3M569_ORYBR